MLGGAGWELVSVQHGVRGGGYDWERISSLIWTNRVAYLKRAVIPNRPVDEPQLVL